MSQALPLSEDQRDCLQEVTNVAMGYAAQSLAELTNLFVHLPIPDIRYVKAGDMVSSFDHIESAKPAHIASQNCHIGTMDCRALLIVSDESMHYLVQSSNVDPAAAGELLGQLFDAVSKACCERFGEMLALDIQCDDYTIEKNHELPSDFDFSAITGDESMVAVEINYHIEAHPFRCNLLLLFLEQDLAALISNLNQLLD